MESADESDQLLPVDGNAVPAEALVLASFERGRRERLAVHEARASLPIVETLLRLAEKVLDFTYVPTLGMGLSPAVPELRGIGAQTSGGCGGRPA